MKKLFAGLVATIMMVGLVSGLGAGVANADPYEGDPVKTYTKVGAPDEVHQGERARIWVNVSAASNKQPNNGHITLRVERLDGGYEFIDVKSFDGGRTYFTTDPLNKRGKYSVRARFDPRAGSRWEDSRDVTTFRVVR